MAKGNILKEAIADAKAVREVALANAKAALEEAFTPKLQNMLSAKLQEDLDEEYYDEDDQDLELGEMGGMHYDEDEGGEEDSMDEEIDLEEILNELELEEGKEADDEEVVDEAKDADDDDKGEQLDEMRPHYKAGNEDGGAMDHRYKAEYVNEGEEFDLDSLLKEINDLDEQAPMGRKVHRPKRGFNPKQRGIKTTAGKKAVKPRRKAVRPGRNVPMMETGCKEKTQELTGKLNEVQNAYNKVKNELSEVNLLNSKLLYVNRIFKANQLDDGQKLRVVETLDKADSAKEAKLIYETIKDTFNVAKSKKVSKKTQTKKTIKESFRGMASKAAGTSRTKKTAPKRAIISESDNLVNRFQKLANIKINE
jgi:hypothetical protein